MRPYAGTGLVAPGALSPGPHGAAGPPAGGLSFLHDPVVLGTPGWSLASDFNCTTYVTASGNPSGSYHDTWQFDDEYGDSITIDNGQGAPTGLGAWKYHAPVGSPTGSGVGSVFYNFTTKPQKLYWGADYKMDATQPPELDEWHAMYVHFTSGDIVLDFYPDGSFELFSDLYTGPGYFSLGAWFQVELLCDCTTQKCSLWCNNVLAINNGSVTFNGSTFSHLEAASTLHGSGNTSVATNLWLARNRVSVYN